MEQSEVFGAYATVRIRFDGDLRALAEKVRRALSLHEFTVEHSEYPPHQEIASAETLGFEMWLERDASEAGAFHLRMETEHALDEIMRDRMHDLSPWLARYLAMICELDVTPFGKRIC